jgi:predicted transcriptional regulator of viral defense system
MDELFQLAEANDGLFTSKQARENGIQDSVLVRLAQRGRLVRAARGVYRIAHFPPDRFAQYREAVLWAQASHGPEQAALSHETALLVFGLSDVNPAKVHLTVPQNARLRRQKPSWIVIHRAHLGPKDVTEHEGIAVTSVERTIADALITTHRADLARQAIADARREGYLDKDQEARLRRELVRYSHTVAREGAKHHSTNREQKEN